MIVMEWLSYDEGECVKYKKSPKYGILSTVPIPIIAREAIESTIHMYLHICSNFVHTVSMYVYMCYHMYVYHAVSIHIIAAYIHIFFH